MKYHIYGAIHKHAKKILKRDNSLPATVKLVDFPPTILDELEQNSMNKEIEINGEIYSGIKKSDIYPVENLVANEEFKNCPMSFSMKGHTLKKLQKFEIAEGLWKQFLESSYIPIGYKYSGLHYGGYIAEKASWCLPSWIWTNAAVVRYHCLVGEMDKAKKLGDIILLNQHISGGWIVRIDYMDDGAHPILAPNDSCYIAHNCCLKLFQSTHDEKYLNAAEKTAAWIMETARKDGMVLFGYDIKMKYWITKKNIVDIGFTAGLFAELFSLTGKKVYRDFLVGFVNKYIDIFYIKEKKCFATCIDENDRIHGGAFGRGQGWALEGLIPTYRVLQSDSIRNVIEETVETLLHCQTSDGGWAYNLLSPLMGIDCKAVPVIAKALLEWSKVVHSTVYDEAISKAMYWCKKNTVAKGEAAGGIFSYTVEGAIVHNKYTSTALVYASSYALEVEHERMREINCS